MARTRGPRFGPGGFEACRSRDDESTGPGDRARRMAQARHEVPADQGGELTCNQPIIHAPAAAARPREPTG